MELETLKEASKKYSEAKFASGEYCINLKHLKEQCCLDFCARAEWQKQQHQCEPINWEQRRYELAKAAMQGLLANHEALNSDVVRRYRASFSGDLAYSAVKYADALIKELKGE